MNTERAPQRLSSRWAKRLVRGLARCLAWIVGGAVALVLLTYLALLAINWRDEPPSAAALRLAAIHRDRTPVADADNGFIYAMAFSTPPAGDSHPYRESRSPAIQAIATACRSNGSTCATELERSDEALRDWITSEQWLLDRYLILLRHPGWREAIRAEVAAAIPAYGTILDGQRLLFARAHLLAVRGDAASVRALLEQDVRFWRRTLAASDILISKMIAVAALRYTFEFGNIVLRRLPPERQLEAMPAEWRVALTDSERSLLRTFAGEWIFGDQVMSNSSPVGRADHALDQTVAEGPSLGDKLQNRLFGPFFQRQNTSNLRADMFLRADAEMQVPFDELSAGFERANARFDDPFGNAGVVHWLYNPIGKVLNLLGSPALSRYAARVADVEGSRRAAVLAVELRSRKVALDDVPTEIANAALRSPYSGEPFLWSPTEQSIVFTGLQTGERARHSLKY